MIQAAVFDLDGLLIDSERWSWQAHNTALETFGLPPLTRLEVLTLVGYDAAQEWLQLLKIRPLIIPHQEYRSQMVDAYHSIRHEKLAPLPGVTEILQLLRRRAIPAGIASNSGLRTIEESLEQLNLRHYFQTVVSVDAVAAGKPAPDVYIEAARRLSAQPEHTVAFEDSYVGVTAAISAGLFTIAVPNDLTAHQDFSRANLRLSSLIEAANWLQECQE